MTTGEKVNYKNSFSIFGCIAMLVFAFALYFVGCFTFYIVSPEENISSYDRKVYLTNDHYFEHMNSFVCKRNSGLCKKTDENTLTEKRLAGYQALIEITRSEGKTKLVKSLWALAISGSLAFYFMLCARRENSHNKSSKKDALQRTSS